MKRFLSIMVLGIALFLPLSAKAASVKVDFNCDKECVDNGDTCQQKCTLGLSGDSIAITEFKANLILSQGLTVQSITPAGSFVNMSNGTSLDFTSATSVTGTKVDIATILINVPKDAKDCSVGIQPTGYDNVTVDIEIKKEEVVKTGAALPIAIISCGVIAACVVYFVSKKNTKMYKI